MTNTEQWVHRLSDAVSVTLLVVCCLFLMSEEANALELETAAVVQ